jgi:hypothetical protein
MKSSDGLLAFRVFDVSLVSFIGFWSMAFVFQIAKIFAGGGN